MSFSSAPCLTPCRKQKGPFTGQLGVWVPTVKLTCGFRWASGADPRTQGSPGSPHATGVLSRELGPAESKLPEGGPRASRRRGSGGRKTQSAGQDAWRLGTGTRMDPGAG